MDFLGGTKEALKTSAAVTVFLGVIMLILVGVPIAISGKFGAFAPNLGLVLLTVFWASTGMLLCAKKKKTRFDIPVGASMLIMFFPGMLISIPIAERFDIPAAIITEFAIGAFVFILAIAASFVRHLPEKNDASQADKE